MKKLFILLPAMLLTLATYADEIEIGSGTSNIIATTIASAADNDVIILTDNGPYVNVSGDDYTKLEKNLTIKAADGVHPVIQYEVPFRSKLGKTVKFIGITFDGTSLTGYDFYFRFYDANDNNLEFEDCEFRNISKYIFDVYTAHKANSLKLTNCYLHNNSSRGILNRGTLTSLEINNSHFEYFTNENDGVIENYSTGSIGSLQISGSEFNNNARYVIYALAGSSMNSCEIENSYFHNNAKSAVYIGFNSTTQACNSLTVENSTFADISGGYNAINFSGSSEVSFTVDASLSVDHCTFFKHPKRAIYWEKSENLNVTNCIFAQPSAINYKSVECVGGTIANCISYNSEGYSSAATRTDNLVGNPYFVNTNSGSYDFSVASFSPAHNAGSDSKNLGDPRWDSEDSAHPTTINISAGTNAIKAAVEAAWPGDEIVLATGTYNESAIIALNKNITIKAADEATPTIVPANGFAISNGAEVAIEGVKIDATSITGHLIYANDATAGNVLTLDGCEIYNYTPTSSLIHVGKTEALDACTINNCYFHNINKSCFFNENTGESNLSITNSTFANITTANSYWAGVIDTRATSGTFLVDHCTFYNVQVISTDYAAIGQVKIASGAVVSNCIFAMPESTAELRAVRDVATANNCLTYNYTKDSGKGIHDDVTKNNCIFADPLFIDPENGDFHIPYNWSTGVFSPAHNAATDGSDLGDPRWYMDEVIPTTDLASAYDLLPTKAQYAGRVEKNASDKIHFTNTETVTDGEVTWKLNITRLCHVSAVVDVEAGCTSGRQLTLTVKDADGNTVATLAQASATYNDNDIDLGSLNISEEGDYTFILTNSTANSSAVLEKVTLSYFGGDTQTITNSDPFETDINDAYFSANGTRADGKISFSGDAVASEWVRWNVTVANSDYYDITLNSAVESGHIYSVTFYDGETQIAQVAESGWHNTTGAITLGRRFLPAGDYVMEIKNSVSSNSHAEIVSVQAIAFVAPVIALPAALPAASAITSELAYAEDGKLYFTPSDKEGYILDQWAKWKVSIAEAGAFLFSMDVNSSNEQSYVITILDSENQELQSYAKHPESGEQTIKHYFNLAAGNYFVMVQNTTNHSAGHIVSLGVSQPEMVTIDEAATNTDSWASKVGETTYDVQIIRTIKAGMYNTICLPFDLSSSQARDIFGADVQLRTLKSADLVEEGQVLDLSFEQTSGIYHGTPHLIKTSQDIVNPVFVGVKLLTATPAATTKTNADFIGNFVAGTIVANPDHLFLGANNTLYFPTVNMEILGMRAYFRIHGAAASAIRRARIVENEQIATEIDLVNGQPTAKSQKQIVNGQLIIVRDGIRYNVMGAKLQ